MVRAPGPAGRILVSSGKVLHELAREEARRGRADDALVSVEELAPVPEAELAEAFGRFPGAREIVWVQEEPANMGALAHLLPVLERLRGARDLRVVSRPASGSPATGSAAAHAREQEELLERAMGEDAGAAQ